MEDEEYRSISDIYQLFNKYGHVINVEADLSTMDLGGYGRTSMDVLMGRSIKMNATFYGRNSMKEFALDLHRLSQLDYEAHLRRENPTLQQAYEEYQILLKLMK